MFVIEHIAAITIAGKWHL